LTEKLATDHQHEPVIASLTARSNAVKMLYSRIQLMRSYLANLPPSYLTTPTSDRTSTPDKDPEGDSQTRDQDQDHPTSNSSAPSTDPQPLQHQPTSTSPASPTTEISHPALRAIQALLHRLPLLQPPDQHAFAREVLAEKADVSLVALLGCLGKSVMDAREMGRKFAVVEMGRGPAPKREGAGGGGVGVGGIGGSLSAGEGFGEGLASGSRGGGGARVEGGFWG